MKREHLQIGSIRGVGIFVHWTTWLLFVALAPAGVLFIALAPGGGWLQWTACCVAFVASYCAVTLLHEVGHTLAAQRRNCPVHWIEIRPVHGLTSHALPRSDKEAIAIAWGGVIAQGLLAGPAWLALHYWGQSLDVAFDIALVMLGPINAAVALVNLIPAPGLDGAMAWRILRRRPKWRPPETALRGRG